MPSTNRIPLRLPAILLALIVGAGLWVRARQGSPAQPDRGVGPDLTSLDAHYYYRLAVSPPAEDRDRQREFPAGSAVPRPLPLLSQVVRFFNQLALPAPSVALWLPSLLGALTAVPVYRLARRLAGEVPALVAAAFMAVTPVWVLRTAIGRLDTDGLILLLFTAGTAASVALIQAGRAKRPVWAAATAWLAALLLLLWTWDQAPDVVCTLFAALAATVTLAAWRTRRDEPGWYRVPLVLAGALVPAFALAAARSPLDLATRLLSRLMYVGQLSPEGFATSESVSELEALTAWDAVTRLGGPLPFLLCATGWILRLRRPHRMDLLPLLPALLLGLMGILSAQRFLIFALPVWAVGIGFCALAVTAWSLPARRSALAALASFAGFLAWRSATAAWSPSVDLPARRVLAALGGKIMPEAGTTPPLCWAWWDLGYPVQCLAGAATVTDGGSHPWTWLVTTARVFTSTDADRAAEALRRLATAETPPHEELDRLWANTSDARPDPRPRYLFLDRRTARAYPWILRMAAWKPGTGLGPERRFQPLEEVRVTATGFLTAAGGFQAQLRPWSPQAAGRIVVSPAGNGLLLVANPAHGVGAVMDESLLETLFVRLYYLDDGKPGDFSVVARDGSALLLRVEPRSAKTGQ